MVRAKWRARCGMTLSSLVLLTVVSWLSLVPAAVAQEGAQPPSDDTVEIMESFNQQALAEQRGYELTDEDKHKILFYMGVALLVLLCSTAYLGVSMVVFGKEVFVAHMISAGLTVTLGLAHAVAAAVWFFPF